MPVLSAEQPRSAANYGDWGAEYSNEITLYFAWLSPHHGANGPSRAGDFPRR